MFENIGKKIKTIAVILMVLGCLGALCWGVLIIGMTEKFFWGFIIILGGCVASWISSCLLYGFGELVDCAQENSDRMADIRSDINSIRVTLNKHAAKTDEKLASMEEKLSTRESGEAK